MRWTRQPVLPAAARDSLPLRRGERVLASALLADGSWVAATRDALLLPGRRVDWASVAHAEWSDDDAMLRIDQLGGAAGEQDTHQLVVDEPGRLPETVRERVMASIVATRHVAIQGRAGVRVVARRVAGEEALVWQVVVDRGLDPADPGVRATGEAAIADLRRDLGA